MSAALVFSIVRVARLEVTIEVKMRVSALEHVHKATV